MDPQLVLDTALSAGAANLGAAEASKIFREQLNSALRVNVMLTPNQRTQLRKVVNFPIIFTGGKVVTNDHPVLVACRDLMRDSFESEFKISDTTERTLVVGAAAREIRKYNSNPHIHYYIHGRENKDYDRIVRPALTELCRILKQKAIKSNPKVYLPPPNHPDATNARPAVKRYIKIKQLLDDYTSVKKLPQTIHKELIKANTLVFEDSFYNFDPDDFVDIFDKTGAEIAYGYGMLPLELLFPEMPENPIYSVSTYFERGVAKSVLTFRQGYCNGYVHDTKKWRTLLQCPVITSPRNKLQLAVEITSRVGPMASFKIYRCRNPETIVRNIELSENQRFVKILDILNSIDRRTGKATAKLEYFTMLETEYLDVVNYLMSLDPKSVTYQNTVAYIRRRMGGMSLITKELVEAWFLPKRLVTQAALTIFMYVKLRIDINKRAIDNIDVGGIWENIKHFGKTVGRALLYPIALIVDWILAGHLVDKLVLDQNDRFLQFGTLKIPKAVEHDDIEVDMHLDNPYEGDIPTCPLCLEMFGRLGRQEVRCNHVEVAPTLLTMTDKEVADMITTLIDTDEDPVGLAAVKKRCQQNMPTSGFTRSVKIYYIKAGPGCGKSYLIRQLATPADLILAPFTKLRPDYLDLVDENGEKYDLQFKTTHRAMETRGCKRIFVDEFTSMPYEYLCCIAQMNAAEEIFLVGDDKQTKVQEPDEGKYIGNYIDLTKVSVHELLVNFRNPKDTVAMLNKIYGYEMRANSHIEHSIEFVTPDNLPKDQVAVRMAFSKVSAKANTEAEKNTVRANQGGTHKRAILFCTIADGATPSVEELQIVGLSRHTEKLYIVVDGCDESIKLREKLSLDTDFYEHMQTWLTFPNEHVVEVIQEDLDVDAIIGVKPVQPPKDMYLMADTLLPSAAFDDVTTSMNQTSSTLVPVDFNTGKVDGDLIIMPKNTRAHPLSLQVNYFAMGSGIGNHFSPKAPMQVLQVLQSRYFNKQQQFELGDKQRKLVNRMVDMWFDECVVRDYRTKLFDDAEIQSVINEFLKKVTSSHYQLAFAGNNGPDNAQGRVIRFHLKGIFKPKHGVPDVYKAGQGISAWSTDACAMFCSVFRILTRLVSATEQPFVVTDAYTSELEFMNNVKRALDGVPKPAKFATTDGITFDANQNAFTQLIEKRYWERYLVPEEFLEHYYSFRRDYKVVSSVAVGFAGTQKTSGEPGTLVNNGVVSKIVSNYQVRGKGPFVIVYKGDDFTKRQINVKIDKDAEAKVNGACALGLRATIADSTEFCGLMFTGGNLFPSIVRRAGKIAAHRFKSYKHFCEYQDSLRNWVELITQANEMIIVACNASHYGTSPQEMESMLDFIKSIAHINRDQFHEVFKGFSEVAVIPTTAEDGKWDFVECAGPADRSLKDFVQKEG